MQSFLIEIINVLKKIKTFEHRVFEGLLIRDCYQISFLILNESNYSRMNQVKSVENNL